MNIEFFVPGHPRPAGSKKAFPHPKTGKILVLDTSGKPGREWRQDVRAEARKVWKEKPTSKLVALNVEFVRQRPKSHYRSNGILKPEAPKMASTKPDLLKLARALEDALTGIIWIDDSQIVEEQLKKTWGDTPGAFVSINVWE